MDIATYDKHTREIEHYSAFTSAFVNKANGEDYVSFRHGDNTLFTRESSLDVISDGTPPGPPKPGDAYDIVLNYLAFDEGRNKYSVTYTDTYSVTMDEFDNIRSDYVRSTPLITDLDEKVVTSEQIIQYDRLRDPDALVKEYENVKGMITDFCLRQAEEALGYAERERMESAERSSRLYNNSPRLRAVIRTRGEALRTHRTECALSDERYEEDKLTYGKKQLNVHFGKYSPAIDLAIDTRLREDYPDLVERYESLPASAKTLRHETMLDEYRHVRSELNGEAMKQLAAECTRQLEVESDLKIRLIRHNMDKPGIIESLREPGKKHMWRTEEDSLALQHDYANSKMHLLWGHVRSGTDSEYVREIVDGRLEAEHPRLFNLFVSKDSVEARVGDRATRSQYILEGMEFYEQQHHTIRINIEGRLQELHDHESRQPSVAKTIATLGAARRNWKNEETVMARQLDATLNQEREIRGVLAFGSYSPEVLQFATDAMRCDSYGTDLQKREQEALTHTHKWLEIAKSSGKTEHPCYEYEILAERVTEEVMHSLAKECAQCALEYKALLEDNYRLQDSKPGFLKRLLTNDGATWSEAVRNNAERMLAHLDKIDEIQTNAQAGADSPAIKSRVDEVLHTLYRPAVERRDATLNSFWQEQEDVRKHEEAELTAAREEPPPEPEHGEEVGRQPLNRANGGRSA